ncbi:MAG: nucleotide exchange factor GrpE [Alphaproteobacteria bacterium]
MPKKKKTPESKEAPESAVEAEATPAEETPAGGAAPEEPEAAAAEAEAEAAEAPAAEAEAEAAEEAVDPAVEIASLKDQLLRALAETENVRRRAIRERDELAKYAITGFARDLLTVVDNLRRAIDAVPDEARAIEGVARLLEGVEMTEREFLAVLERHHIRRIDPLGEKFDHNFHQAMFEVEASEKPAGTVVEVMQAGYAIADRLLRPAMVAVAKKERTEAPQHVDTKV